MANITDSREMLQAKRRIMMNQPHKTTVSDDFVSALSLSKAEKASIKDGIIYFDPVWAGSGPATINNKHQFVQRTAINYRINNKLPSGYRRVEYISNYQRYNSIDTGISGADDSLEFQFKVKIDTGLDYASIFGNDAGSDGNTWRLIQGSSDTNRVKLYVTCNRRPGSSETITLPSTYVDKEMEMYISFQKYVVKIDGQEAALPLYWSPPGTG